MGAGEKLEMAHQVVLVQVPQGKRSHLSRGQTHLRWDLIPKWVSEAVRTQDLPSALLGRQL